MRQRDVVGAVLMVFAIVEAALGVYMLVDPGSFHHQVGPFGVRNDHYTRDAGTFTLAVGVAAAIAVRRPAWRVGVVGYAFLQSVFHSVNHLVDIDKAHPHSRGPLDFVSLALSAALLGWLLSRSLRERGRGAGA